MSNCISGPFKKNSGPPYLYNVSFPDIDPLFNGEHWYKILKKHAQLLDIPCKSRKIEDGYKLAFLESDDFDRILTAMESDIKIAVDAASCYSEQLHKRYANPLPN